MTIRLDVPGRPHLLLVLERLLEYFGGYPGMAFRTFDEIADDFRRRNPRQAASVAAARTT